MYYVLFTVLYEWNVKKVLIFPAIYIYTCFYGIMLTETPVLLDFPAIRGFSVTNLLLVQYSILVRLYFCGCKPVHPSLSTYAP